MKKIIFLILLIVVVSSFIAYKKYDYNKNDGQVVVNINDTTGFLDLNSLIKIKDSSYYVKYSYLNIDSLRLKSNINDLKLGYNTYCLNDSLNIQIKINNLCDTVWVDTTLIKLIIKTNIER